MNIDVQAQMQNLSSSRWSVRQQAFSALAPLLPTDAAVRDRVLELTKDGNWSVRQQAFSALAPLVPTDAAVREALSWIRDDIHEILSHAPNEVPALRAALCNGKVDGSTYSGECACLVGTIAKARDCGIYSIPGVVPDADRPAERFFSGIRKGDRPEGNPISAAALYWVDEWMRKREEQVLAAVKSS